MHKVLIVWDARQAPKQLQHFIQSFKEACLNFEIEASFLSFSHKDWDGMNQCQYSMRALLNSIHYHQPNTIMSIGCEANLLTKLIKPALKIPLICHKLPSTFEFAGKVTKQIDRVTKSFSANCYWSYTKKKRNHVYFPSTLIDSTMNKVGIIQNDPMGPLLANVVKQQNIDVSYFHYDSHANLYDALPNNCGLIIASTQADPRQALASYAASHGIITLYVGQLAPIKHAQNYALLFDHVDSSTDIALVRKIRYWKTLSTEQKHQQARALQHQQSRHNGLLRFLHDLGFEGKHQENQIAFEISLDSH